MINMFEILTLENSLQVQVNLTNNIVRVESSLHSIQYHGDFFCFLYLKINNFVLSKILNSIQK